MKLMSKLEDGYVPKTLCAHFWTVFFSLFLLVIFGPLIIVASAILAGAEKLPKRTKGSKGKKQPGIVRSYIKARKQKVCPLIEVVD